MIWKAISIRISNFRITNSPVGVGLCYGLFITFSMWPSYFLLLQAWFLEEKTDEDPEKRASATTGLLMGQLIVFLSTFHGPLHRTLARPNLINFLAVAFWWFHFYRTNDKDPFLYVDYGTTIRKFMDSFVIEGIFLSNAISPLLHHFLLPMPSAIAGIVSIFRCNKNNFVYLNKYFFYFIISCYVSWLMSSFFFFKCLEFLLVWIQKKNSPAKWRNYIDRILTILLFLLFLRYYRLKKPTPQFFRKQINYGTLSAELIENKVEVPNRIQIDSQGFYISGRLTFRK